MEKWRQSFFLLKIHISMEKKERKFPINNPVVK